MSTSALPLKRSDALVIPVWVRQGIATNGVRRPSASAINGPHPAWTGPWPPKDGWYDVATTWRDVLDSATTVGRDPSPWLVAHPALARQEILARTAPLAAYLHHDGSSTPAAVRPSPVYEQTAEKSARAVMSYRLGMTMTEWVATRMIGLPTTVHHEQHSPSVSTPKWFGPGKRPDLWCEEPTRTPSIWSLEAKGQRRLGQKALRDGAEQLAALDQTVLPYPHARVLVGASMEDHLFAIVQHELVSGAGTGGGVAPPAPGSPWYQLARSRLLIQLLLQSAAPAERRVRLVARDGGAPRYGEEDQRTQALRAELADTPAERAGPLEPPVPDGATEMLTATLPELGITVGLSAGLYRACEQLGSMLYATTEQVALEREEWSDLGPGPTDARPGSKPRPRKRKARSDDELEAELDAFEAEVDERLRGRRNEVAVAYDRGVEEGTSVLGAPPRQAAAPGLEVFTDDTYLAVAPDSVLLTPFRA